MAGEFSKRGSGIHKNFNSPRGGSTSHGRNRSRLSTRGNMRGRISPKGGGDRSDLSRGSGKGRVSILFLYILFFFSGVKVSGPSLFLLLLLEFYSGDCVRMARTIDISSFYCANFPLGGGRGGRGSWSDRGGRGSWSDRGGRGSWGGHGRGGRGKSGQGRKGFSANNGGGMDFKKRMSFDIDNRFGKNKLKTLFFCCARTCK